MSTLRRRRVRPVRPSGPRSRKPAGLVALVLAGAALLATTTASSASPAAPTASSHAFVSGVSLPADFASFECSFTVPALPATYAGQSVFLWCGVQQIDAQDPDLAFGVLQPVLMYGPDCVSSTIGLGPEADPQYGDTAAGHPAYWYFSAQYVYPDPSPDGPGTCVTSPDGFVADPGDVIESSMSYDPGTDAVTVSMTDGASTSTLVVAHPWLDPTKSWASLMGRMQLQMTIEAAELGGPGEWPATPSQWPVTMTYEGADPIGFRPEPRTFAPRNIPVVPGIACAAPTVAGSTATAVCTYDLAATQIFPIHATTTVPAVATPPAVAAVAITPTFTG